MANLSVGIVGLPNAGKSTLFNALLGRQISQTAEYPFCTIKPHHGIVEIPDENLKKLSAKTGIEKIVPAVMEFVDLAGLVKGAHKGEGLGNQFLAHIQECQAILFLLRAFENQKVELVGSGGPVEDFEILKMELCLKDLEKVNNVKCQMSNVKTKTQMSKLKKIKDKVEMNLDSGKMVGEIKLTSEEQEIIKDWFLLTSKPYLIVVNVNEKDLKEKWVVAGKKALTICAELEEELIEFEEKERKEYLEVLGVKESSLNKVIKETFLLLDLIVFYTVTGGRQVQAWPVKKGTPALEAAGIIHSDFEKNFIKAKVTTLDNFLSEGNWPAVEKSGRLQLKGRDYQIKDKEVVEFVVGRQDFPYS